MLPFPVPRVFSRPRRFVPRGILCRVPLLLLLLLGAVGALQAQTVDPGASLEVQSRQRREAFLRAREEMRTIPLPTQQRPTAKPTPAPQPSVEPAPPVPAETPEPTATPGRTVSRNTPTPPPATPEPSAPVVVEKSGGGESEANTDYATPPRKRYFFGLLGGGPSYRYLTPSVLNALDHARVRAGRWKYIVVHNSGTRQGNARIFDYYHRHTRHMPNGLAYHFVIGNGTSTGDGQIEIGDRWKRQINGGHVHSDYLNDIALGICLVGDFNRDIPTRAQYAALDELITYLRKRVGRVDRRLSIVKAHREINPVPTDCPGNRFSYAWLHRKYD